MQGDALLRLISAEATEDLLIASESATVGLNKFEPNFVLNFAIHLLQLPRCFVNLFNKNP